MSPNFVTVEVEIDQGVGLVTLNRPDQLNAFNRQMTNEFFAALDQLDADDAVRAIVVTGAGRAFSAGADLSEGFGRAAPAPEPDDGGRSSVDVKPWEMRTPIIAAINGAAVGMGITYPLLWDIRLAADDAKIGLVFTRRGILPEANSLWLLSRLIGAARALELLLTGRTITGREAAELGLVNRSVPGDRLLDEALELGRDIAVNTAPASVALTKRLFYKYLEEGDRMAARAEELEMFQWTLGQPDVREGVAAFRERRAPEWSVVSEDDLPL